MPMTPLVQPLLDLPRPQKRVLAVAADALLCIVTVWIALCLRMESWVAISGVYWLPVLASLAVALPIFGRLGLYRAIFRYSGGHALRRLVLAGLVYGVVYATLFTVIGVNGVPRLMGVVQPMFLMLGVAASRHAVRYWLGDHYLRRLARGEVPRLVIYGAGSAGRQLAAALRRAAHEQRVVAFLDDDPRLIGQIMDGHPIHSPEDIAALIEDQHVTDVLLAIPSVARARRNEILGLLRRHPLHVRTLPGVSDLAAGRIDLGQVRELDVEDLLGRDSVAPDQALLTRLISGHAVMVTGAGGSIGSELCRQILRSRPARLLLVEQSEFALYQIHRELEAGQAEAAERIELVPLLASVQDAARMTEIIGTWHPHTIYHAAAYKHVPLVEHNPAEGIKNNVWGTWTVARVAAEHGIANMVLISTDKAVRPTNIMGASKRLSEMVLQGLAGHPMSERTTFSMVRFGNVLGSSGSVVPLFREQIRGGGPITLTHQDITRYFMTIPEAAQLVLQAGSMAVGGDVFVLDMGQPVRIMDLARRMVALSGQSVRDADNPGGEIEIRITGLRPGEKLYEELLIGNDPQPTQHARIMKAHEDMLPWEQLHRELLTLEGHLRDNDVPAIREALQRLVSGYRPAAEVVDLVHLELAREGTG